MTSKTFYVRLQEYGYVLVAILKLNVKLCYYLCFALITELTTRLKSTFSTQHIKMIKLILRFLHQRINY